MGFLKLKSTDVNVKDFHQNENNCMQYFDYQRNTAWDALIATFHLKFITFF